MISTVAVIGGGLSGVYASILLARAGLQVTLFEKNTFPAHKVCGEYISNEVLELLHIAGFDPFAHGAVDINELELTGISGKSYLHTLPLGAFGISRYKIDHELCKIARASGVTVMEGNMVSSIQNQEDHYIVYSNKGIATTATVVIGAYGKYSNIDQLLHRRQQGEYDSYIGVKYHIKYPYPSNRVGLYNFKGGYCGVSTVENQTLNVCYLASTKDLKKYGDIKSLEQNLHYRNPELRRILTEGEHVWELPKVISKISFRVKKPLEDGIFITGDAAGLIPPLCGNGMAMAIHSGYMLAELLIKTYRQEISLETAAHTYEKTWKKQFKLRLTTGGILQKIFEKPGLSNSFFKLSHLFPGITANVIKNTHGAIIHPSLS